MCVNFQDLPNENGDKRSGVFQLNVSKLAIFGQQIRWSDLSLLCCLILRDNSNECFVEQIFKVQLELFLGPTREGIQLDHSCIPARSQYAAFFDSAICLKMQNIASKMSSNVVGHCGEIQTYQFHATGVVGTSNLGSWPNNCHTILKGRVHDPAIVKILPNSPRIKFVTVSSAFVVVDGAVFRVAASLVMAAINRALMSWPVS